ncbi:MAG: 50S ribosomal protein L21 [Alphaproteobacteria bacterium]|nr:50S ribosomal protein L21 [Alphaproteobacteria bacterium]
MYAVISSGGKQYRVEANQELTVEKIEGEAGAKLNLTQVLAVGTGASLKVGSPTVAGASVAAEIVRQDRGPHLLVFKKRRRQNSRRKNGHRQDLTVIKITEIKV